MSKDGPTRFQWIVVVSMAVVMTWANWESLKFSKSEPNRSIASVESGKSSVVDSPLLEVVVDCESRTIEVDEAARYLRLVLKSCEKADPMVKNRSNRSTATVFPLENKSKKLVTDLIHLGKSNNEIEISWPSGLTHLIEVARLTPEPKK